MAPEVLLEKPSPGDLNFDHNHCGTKVDVWSLGIILIELLLVCLIKFVRAPFHVDYWFVFSISNFNVQGFYLHFYL